MVLAAAILSLAMSDCTQTTVGFEPLDDLGPALYLGQYEGGLYAGGVNEPPAAHAAEGMERARGMQPLGLDGAPDPDGAIVMISIGMSNTSEEFCSHDGPEPCSASSLMGKAELDPLVDHDHLVLVNGARPGNVASVWTDPNAVHYDVIQDVIEDKGLTEAQVQVAWVKVTNAHPDTPLPAPNADAFALQDRIGRIARALRVRYPNISMVFLSSRIYAGYADGTLNPEPFAYETGFAVKWAIDAQVQQMAGGGIDPIAGDLDFTDGTAPWLAWGAYLWADGLSPRSDGLTWTCQDFEGDGLHPSFSGEHKAADALLEFFLTSPFSEPWFANDGGSIPGDVDGDGVVSTNDLLDLLAMWGPCDGQCDADLNEDGVVDVADLLIVIAAWS